MKRELMVGAIGVGTALFFVTCAGYPFVHNRYVHPLGRLSHEIVIDQPCDSVANRFAIYVETGTGSSHAQYSDHELTHDLFFTQEIPPARGLSLHDTNLFDDLQIRVRCNADGLVAEKLVILD